MSKNIAVYGGSFDPPHKSHVSLSRSLSKLPYIDEVWVVPCGDRTDKKLLLSNDTRFNIVSKIFQNDSHIKVEDHQVEMCKKLGRMLHIYEVLKQFSKRFGDHKFYIAVGGDIFQTLQTWGYAKQLKDQFEFIIFQRKGYQISQEKLPLKFKMCQDELQQMSSTNIKKILRDESIPKENKLTLIQEFLPEQAIECLKKEEIL